MNPPPPEQDSSKTKQFSSNHPINIRLSLPFIGKRYFLTIIGGSEQRSPERRVAERKVNPVKTTSNVLFITGFAVIFYAVAFIAIAIQSSIVEF